MKEKTRTVGMEAGLERPRRASREGGRRAGGPTGVGGHMQPEALARHGM